MDEFIGHAREYEHNNIWMKYSALPKKDQKNKELIEQLRQFDEHVNVSWPLVHFKSAVRYLHMKEEDIVATGGTNWQKYLPPRFQRRIFFPELWTAEQKAEWGKSWVHEVLAELES